MPSQDETAQAIAEHGQREYLLKRIGAAVLERVDGKGYTGGSGVWVCPACGIYKPQIESDEGHHNDCPITEALEASDETS